MSLLQILAIYGAGFLLVQIAAWLALRREPTAHGQIVGRQIGCAVGLLWPVAIPYIAVVSLIAGIVKAARWAAYRWRRP